MIEDRADSLYPLPQLEAKTREYSTALYSIHSILTTLVTEFVLFIVLLDGQDEFVDTVGLS